MIIQNIMQGVYKIGEGKAEEITPAKYRGVSPKELKRVGFGARLPFSPADIRIDILERGVVVTVPLGRDELVYGLGLSNKAFIQNGYIKKLVSAASDHDGMGYSHAAVPFYATTAGYAVYIDTARSATFLVGTNNRRGGNETRDKKNNIIIVNEEDLYKEQGHADSCVLVDIPAARGIDVYVFYDDNIGGAVERFNMFSGGGALPPMWGLGVKYRSRASHVQADIVELARMIRGSEVPCDYIGLEPGWQTHAYSSTYDWEKSRFPDPDGLVKTLKDQGLRLDLWQQAYVDKASPVRKPLEGLSGDFEVWNGLVPDFTLEQVRNIYKDYHGKNLIDKGVCAFKLDECDGDPTVGANHHWIFPSCSVFPSGADGEQMRQLLGVLFQRAMYETFKSRNTRTYGEVRASNAMGTPYPFVLYSDEYNFNEFVNYIASSSVNGVLWSPELRDSESFSDYARRVGVLTFAALFNFNAWQMNCPSWLQPDIEKNNAKILLEDSTEYLDVVRKYTNLRMSLIPYIYSAFAKYNQSGTPPVRAMILDYPHDGNVSGISDQWIFGDSILVAPITPRNSFKELIPIKPEKVFGENADFSAEEGGYEISTNFVNEGLAGVKFRFTVREPGRYIIRFDCKSSIDIVGTRLHHMEDGVPHDIGRMYKDSVSAPHNRGGAFSEEITLEKAGIYELFISKPWARTDRDNIRLGVHNLSIVQKVIKGDCNRRQVYLPGGNWYDLFTNQKYGRGWNEIERLPDETPVFVKEGSIVPFAKPMQYVADNCVFDITARVYGKDAKDFILYEDDGISYNFENGEFNTVTLGADKTVTRAGDYKGIRYNVVGFDYIV